MNDKSDAQLLRDYARHGDEAAFRELVLRHTNLVYSSALRQLQSSDLACDVVQSVFCDLARKAKPMAQTLGERASLLGWLFRSTRFAALKQLRGDQRRQARERQAMEQLDPSSASAPQWESVQPLLDEAMADLDDQDREALLLRFFQNQDLRSLGTALGVSEDAAQKRVSRALERLRVELSHRGVTTTAVALAATVSANAVGIAPAGVAASAAAAALASVATASGVGLTSLGAMGTAKVKATLVCALAAIGLSTPLLVQRHAINRFQTENAALRQQLPQTSRMPPFEAQLRELSATNTLALSPEQRTELLRLRGQVGMLRRELAAANAQSLAGLQVTNPLVGFPSPTGHPAALNSDQAEAFVKQSGRTALSLLAAYFASGDPAFLKEASAYTNDARVALTALAERPSTKEEVRLWLGRLTQADSDNALANYLLAADYLESGLTEQGLRELLAASSKPKFDEHWSEASRSVEEAYLAAGFSEFEAKLNSLDWAHGTLLPNVSSLKRIGDKCVALAEDYRKAGDPATAQAVMELGLNLGQRLADASRATPIEYLCGIVVQDRVLAAMDPDTQIAHTGSTVRDLREEVAAQRQIPLPDYRKLIPTASPEDLIKFVDCVRNSGAVPAIQWLAGKQGQP